MHRKMKAKILNMVKSLIGYKRVILSGSLIIVPLGASYFYFGELNPVIAVIGGLLLSIPIRFFWQVYTSPVLAIRGVELRICHLGKNREWEYVANNIIVENRGRSAAKNCKGNIVVGDGKERVCWTVPKERSNATINAKDEERLYFCAFYKSGRTHDGPMVIGKGEQEVPRIIAPTEEGWQPEPLKCRQLDEIETCKVLVTADNAEPVEAQIKFNTEKGKIEIVTTQS
jgi:hypothetical protein